jgi:hypothetical protein
MKTVNSKGVSEVCRKNKKGGVIIPDDNIMVTPDDNITFIGYIS